MKRILCAVLLLVLGASQSKAQVDVAHRRTVLLQSSASLNGEERLNAVGFYWFNENNYPWTNTALRVIFAGVYLGAELSYFLPAQTNTAIGIGAGGGAFIEGVTPYFHGERPTALRFDGDGVQASVFVNQTIPNPSPLPLNVRANYQLSGAHYRGEETGFVIPDNTLTQTLQAELRLGGTEPGLGGLRGAELYLAADANYRTGFTAFGPAGSLYPEQNQYQRLLGSLSAKLPVGPVTLSGRLAGGAGNDLDQISAWRIGGNLVGTEAVSYPVRGYYTREFLAADFAIANLELIFPICKKCGVRGHLYADWAALKLVPPYPQDWDNIFGVGAGVSFRAPWGVNVLLTYGYGLNAVREGDRGGHEIAIGLEKSF